MMNIILLKTKRLEMNAGLKREYAYSSIYSML